MAGRLRRLVLASTLAMGCSGAARHAPAPASVATAPASPTPPAQAAPHQEPLGAINRGLIDEVIRLKMSQIRYCYQRELTKVPGLHGLLRLRFTIAPDGTVPEVAVVESTIPSDAVAECVMGRFRAMQFPAPTGGKVIVTYPFVFEPGPSAAGQGPP